MLRCFAPPSLHRSLLIGPIMACLFAPSSAQAICDVIPQPEILYRGETGSLNRVYAGPNDGVRIQIDSAGCEAGSPGFAQGFGAGASSDFNDQTLQGWTAFGSHWQFTVQDFGLGPSLYGDGADDGSGARAPIGFLGNWASQGVTQLNYLFAPFDFANIQNEDVVRISGPGGSAAWRPSLGLLQPFQAVPIQVPIDTVSPPADWVVTGGAWAALMAQVDELTIIGAFGSFQSYVLDDITLAANGSSGSVATILFEPPNGTANAVVIPAGGSCAGLAAQLTACEGILGGGTATCRDDLAPDVSAAAFAFPIPDQGFAGPVTLAVTPQGAALPCGLATTSCGGPGAPGGLLACIDTLFASDGTCEADPMNAHETFAGFTVLPAPNDFSGVCDSSNPSIPCNDSNADVRITTDAEGNLLVPIDWRGVLVPGTLPIPRLVRASSSVAAFAGPPPEASQTPGAPIRVPGAGFLQSFSPKGLRVDPLFNPLFDEQSVDTELFGSADAEFGVIRVLRRSPAALECAAGDRAGLACTNDGQCPLSTCGGAVCRGGANAGVACTGDGQCPSGECGSALFEFGDRYSNGGSGPVLLTSAEYDAEALNPSAIEGLVANEDLFMFVRSEPLEGADLNADGDQTDTTVVSLRDSTTGAVTSLDGADGRASLRSRAYPFRLPAVAVEDDIVAYLESEPGEAGSDANGDGDGFDSILRVYQLSGGSAQEVTSGLAIPVDGVSRIDGAPVGLSDGLVFYRVPELADATVTTQNVGDIGYISPSGRFLIELEQVGAFLDVILEDRDTDEDGIFDEVGQTSTTQVNVMSDGSQQSCAPQCGSQILSLDATEDGRTIVFLTDQRLAVPDNPPDLDVYMHDRDADGDGIFDEPGAISTTILTSGIQFNNPTGVNITASGRFVAYGTSAGVEVFDRDTDDDGLFDEAGATSVDLVVPGGAFQLSPASQTEMQPQGGISENGRWITYVTTQDLVANDVNGQSDVYAFDRDADEDGIFDEAGATEILLLSAETNGQTTASGSVLLGVSDDARFVAFADPSNSNFIVSQPRLLIRDRDPDEDGRFDEPGQTDLQVYAQPFAPDDFQLSPDGRYFSTVGGTVAAGSGPRDFRRSDQETEGSELLANWSAVGASKSLLIADRARAVIWNNPGPFPVLFGSDSSDVAADLNADGDLEDTILFVADARAGAPLASGQLGAAGRVALAGGNAAYLRSEEEEGVDLNGDFDTEDEVVHLYRNRQIVPPANLGLAARAIAVSEVAVAALVSEADEGVLLNGDGDFDDTVVHVNDVATGTSGTWTNLFLAADEVQAAGRFVAFTVPESDQGTPLNGDGDLGDRVLRVYDVDAGQFLALVDDQGLPLPGVGPAVDDFVLGEEIVAFRVSEEGQGQNLNGVAPPIPGGVADGDLLDSVIHAADLATGIVFNGMQAALPCPVEACDPRVPYRVVGKKVTHLTLEAAQGGNDLDQSGDGGTGLVLQHFNVSALQAGGSMTDACDLLAGALAGVCTGSAEACASNADCSGAGTCYFPPGGCLFDSGIACTVANPGQCAANQFCAPILGNPGQGTCQELQGPCLDDGQCGVGAFCIDDGADPERLFASVSAEVDGRQRFVSVGRCSDGDGSCANDDDCNTGATCDADQTVIATAGDADADGLADPIDNCPDIANGDQLDIDSDGVGDACDRETCGNGIQEYAETCDHGDQNGVDGVCDAACAYVGGGVACADGIDNDGDGEIDLGDSGCLDGLDDSERDPAAPCDDGRDNDGDYRSDFGSDTGCFKLASVREDPQCSDGIDNDGDGTVDWDGAGYAEPDTFCGGLPGKARERPPAKNCGVGAEIALLLPALWWLRRGSARSRC